MNSTPEAYVTREEFDQQRGAVARELGGIGGRVSEVQRIVLEGIGELRRDVMARLDGLGDDLEELKERSQVIELGRVKKENKNLRAEIERREARGDKRTDWLMTFIIGAATAAAGAFFSWLATRGH